MPLHTDAVQAVGQLPVDFAASGRRRADLSPGTRSAARSASARWSLRRGVDLTPLLHGGGQERDVRSGTLDTPAIAGFAVALSRSRSSDRERRASRLAALRDELVRRVQRGGAGRRAATATRPRPLGCRATPTSRFPGCEGDALLMLLDARGIECSTGSACSAGVPQPSHVLLAMGADEDRRAASLRFSLGHTSTAADVDALVEAIGPVVERARRAPAAAAAPAWRLMRVLAAMSGGVDSAVAAARAVDAGHDVTGVHLALSRNPQSYRDRRARLLHARGRPRRPPGRRRHRHPVLRLGPRASGSREDVVEDFVAEYAAGRTPNPCLRCNEKIKFAAVLDRGARARLRRRLHRPLRAPRRRSGGPSSCTAPSTPARTSPTCSACSTRDQLAGAMFPLGDSPKAEVRGEAAARGLAVADKPDSHDICFIADGDTAGWLRAAGSVARHRATIVDADGAVLGEPRRRVRVHRRPAPRAADRRPAAGRAAALRRSTSSRSPAP